MLYTEKSVLRYILFGFRRSGHIFSAKQELNALATSNKRPLALALEKRGTCWVKLITSLIVKIELGENDPKEVISRSNLPNIVHIQA